MVITIPVGIVATAWAVEVADRHVGVDDDRRPIRRLWRTGIPADRVLFAAVLLGWLVLPIAVYLVARWFIAPAVAATDRTNARGASRQSAAMTRGRRIRTFAIAAVAISMVFVAGALLGTFMLILTTASFALVNVVAGVVGAVLLPWLGIVVAMTHGDLRSREAPAN